jgi:parallel beta-helix repeat protein
MLRRLLLLWLGFGVLASPAIARVYVVAPDGNDSASGAATEPFRTISHAAGLATAGDTVRVKAGTYHERVVVTHSGEPHQPIVFTAEQVGKTILTGDTGFEPSDWAGDDDVQASTRSGWITIRGFTFRDSNTPYLIRAAKGWRVENCEFSHTGFGVNIRGDDVRISHTVFEDINGPNAHAIVAVNSQRPLITNVVIRRVNGNRQVADIPRSAVTKFSGTNGLVVDHLLSEDNVGPGLWLDWDNQNFVVRRSVLRNNRGDHADWEGGGLWLEANGDARGIVSHNTFSSNTGPGIAVMESSNIRIKHNRLAGDRNCLELRNLPRGDDGKRSLGDLDIAENTCVRPSQAAILADVGNWQGWDPERHGIKFRDNSYQLRKGIPAFSWAGRTFLSVADARQTFGFETEGPAVRKEPH